MLVLSVAVEEHDDGWERVVVGSYVGEIDVRFTAFVLHCVKGGVGVINCIYSSLPAMAYFSNYL